MDIEKDSNREAFEEWYCKNHTALKQSDLAKFRTLSDYSFSDSLKINISWEAWQAAKAKANKQFENFIDQAIEDSACADERRSLQALLEDFQDSKAMLEEQELK